MTNEIRLAFAHPSERAAASVADTTYDRISLRDYTVSVEIGAFQLERGVTQRVCFNVVVEVLPISDPIDDDVDRILSYDRVTEAIDFELAAERLNLLETLAERIADRILAEPQAVRVFVRIEKLDRGPGALGVEIVRARSGGADTGAKPAANEIPHPKVLYLTNDSIHSPHLENWLDHLERDAIPVILCVGLPDSHDIDANHSAVQRRIDLLALEQNAWILADLDPRCVVVATRTELDWSMKHGKISVWAPSKMLLDAVEPPKCDPRNDAVGLAAWLSQDMQAQELVMVGTSQAPETTCVVSHISLDAMAHD